MDYEQYDRTALAAIWQQRANALGAEIEHGHERPARARGDHHAADTYAAEDAAVRRDYRQIRDRAERIATMRRWDARLAELKTAREN
ncbi:hypothetical protein [uncultured Corynebacterium sp.]|uniref:hypothetical protein n=1 Tax=uncultured Corynebacterium sp. TaxID=159447 RepID=UPI0025CC6C45|nr:hypothetical protein [uncultured Corynebacterium sp.]